MLDQRFLVESNTIENVTFPNKSALSKANVKKNSMRNTKCTKRKDLSQKAEFYVFYSSFL